jgi:hypothetical protein
MSVTASAKAAIRISIPSLAHSLRDLQLCSPGASARKRWTARGAGLDNGPRVAGVGIRLSLQRGGVISMVIGERFGGLQHAAEMFGLRRIDEPGTLLNELSSRRRRRAPDLDLAQLELKGHSAPPHGIGLLDGGIDGFLVRVRVPYATGGHGLNENLALGQKSRRSVRLRNGISIEKRSDDLRRILRGDCRPWSGLRLRACRDSRLSPSWTPRISVERGRVCSRRRGASRLSLSEHPASSCQPAEPRLS